MPERAVVPSNYHARTEVRPDVPVCGRRVLPNRDVRDDSANRAAVANTVAEPKYPLIRAGPRGTDWMRDPRHAIPFAHEINAAVNATLCAGKGKDGAGRDARIQSSLREFTRRGEWRRWDELRTRPRVRRPPQLSLLVVDTLPAAARGTGLSIDSIQRARTRTAEPGPARRDCRARTSTTQVLVAVGLVGSFAVSR